MTISNPKESDCHCRLPPPMNSGTLQTPLALICLAISTTSVSAIPIEAPTLFARDTSTSGLSCDAATWKTVILFFILNYGAHAFTIKHRPGENDAEFSVGMLAALLLPYCGMYRALYAIAKCKFREESDLHHALRLGALCQVVCIQNNEQVVDIPNDEQVDEYIESSKVHGQISLPDGYRLKTISKDDSTNFEHFQNNPINLSGSRNTLKSLIAISQLIFSCITLYRARGDQIDKFGYAAYGLTVAQYAVMSLVNIISNLTTPDYPSRYMVRTSVMEEAVHDGGVFVGWVATLDHGNIPLRRFTRNASYEDGSILPSEQDPDVRNNTQNAATAPEGIHNDGDGLNPIVSDNLHQIDRILNTYANRYRRMLLPFIRTRWETCWFIFACSVCLVAIAAPYVIIGGISRFHKGGSTKAQRVWTMAWLTFGQYFGLMLAPSLFRSNDTKSWVSSDFDSDFDVRSLMAFFGRHRILKRFKNTVHTLPRIYVTLCFGATAIGGLVVVAQMIIADGYCVLAA